MASNNVTKSSQNQATLFQTWGYSDSHETVSGATKKPHRKDRKKVNDVNSTAQKNSKGEEDKCHAPIIVDDDDDDLGEFFECFDDNDDLCKSVAAVTKETYLESNFDPTTSPESLSGFDSTSGHNFIYPVNYPVREYQFKIIIKALLKNTLVVLPTGLGKTFIAAVVMYNYYRWYPQGKIIFMAPTKPLVAQQIQACYDITGTPSEDTAEMTGSISPSRRKVLWETKRVFFLTPHVLQNDLGRGACFAKDIVCLVFDEAHKALGNYAYCQVIKEIYGMKSNFRVLALSATPGGDLTAVQQVVTNLMISHVELRSEDSHDIKPYVFGRDVEKIVVPLSDELKKAKQQFTQVLEGLIQRLCTQGVCWQRDATKISKYFLLKARDQFRARGMEDKTRLGMIEGDFALAISLYHAYELLQQHGILSFYNFLKEICSGTKGTARGRYELMRHEKFMEMMEDLRQRIEPPDDADGSLNGSFIDMLTPKRRLLKSIPKPNSLFSSHPKLKKLEEIVVKHFEAAKENLGEISTQTPLNTRIMIFSQYRDSVQEITAVLSKYQPLVKVMSFVGQNATGKGNRGLSQKEQLEVVERFRKGGYNVLVSTSVGEEGLDIGDVDLIVCFDASNSPIRLVQRMGRTGRKRAGRIIILVTEGKEDQIYKRSLSNKNNIHKKLLDATNSLVLYDENPRMIPKHMNPYCLKMQVTVPPKQTSNRGVKRKSTEDKPKKVSRSKIDKNPDKNDQSSETLDENATKKLTEKKTRKKRITEKKLDKAKAWRRSTLRMKAISLSDEDDDDFQLEKNEDDENRKLPPTEEKAQCDDVGQDAPLVNEEEYFLDEIDNGRRDVFENECKGSEPNHIDYVNVANGASVQNTIKKTDEHMDDDFICTQNISSFLPSSTPTRHFQTLPSSSNSCRLNRNVLKMPVVPSPPKYDDLDDILDDDLSICHSANRTKDMADDGECGDHYGISPKKRDVSFNAIEDPFYENTADWDASPKEKDDIREFAVSNPIFTQSKNVDCDVLRVSKVACFQEDGGNTKGEVSNLDLFGDSLIDFEDDFEDCPSPPVVTQVKPKYDEEKPLYAPVNRDSLDYQQTEIEFNAVQDCSRKRDSSFLEFNKTKDSLFPSQKDDINGGKAVDGVDNVDSIQDLIDLDDTTFDMFEEAQSAVPEYSPATHANVLDDAAYKEDLIFKKIKSPVICNNEALVSAVNYSPSSDSDCGLSIPSLATRIKNRNVVNVDYMQKAVRCSVEKKNENSPNISNGSKVTDTKPSENIRSEFTERTIANTVLDSHSQEESPVTKHSRRRRKGIGRITDDSPSPRKPIVTSRSDISDDEFDNCVLRRRKAKKVGVFKSPAVQHRNRSSDEDFEGDTSMSNEKHWNNRRVRFSSKNETSKKRAKKSHFIDDEADLSGDDSGDDEMYTDVNEYILDSFIDDATQMTQVTPHHNRKGADESVDMAAIYRQSVFSPMYSALKFGTPAFKANRNRYKMAQRNNWHQLSDDDDEAIEVNSFIDDEGDFEGYDTEGESESLSCDEVENTKVKERKHKGKTSRIKRIISSDDNETDVDETKPTKADDFEIGMSKKLHDKGDAKLTKTQTWNKNESREILDNNNTKPTKADVFEGGMSNKMRDKDDAKLTKTQTWNKNESREILDNNNTKPTKADVFEGGMSNKMRDKDDTKLTKTQTWNKNESKEMLDNNNTKPTKTDNFERGVLKELRDKDDAKLTKTQTWNKKDLDDNNNTKATKIETFERFMSKGMPEKDAVCTEQVNCAHNAPEKGGSCFVYPPSKNGHIDWENADFVSRLNAADFVPCFDLGINIGNSKITQHAVKVTDSIRSNSTPIMRNCESSSAEHSKQETSKREPSIFASTKIVASSQIGSILRLHHHVQLTVCSHLGCDFVVSKRMGILRKIQSDVSNGANNAKTRASIHELLEHYSRSCIIIEKDRLKGSSTTERHFSYSKYFTGLLAYLANRQVKILFSDSQEDTALLIYHLTEVESEGNYGLPLTAMKLKNNHSEKMLKVLLTIPYITYPLAVRLCNEYICLRPLINSSMEEIKARIPELAVAKAKKIFKYFRHKVLNI